MQKRIVIGTLAALSVVIFIGGFAMMRKTVKQERFDLTEISAITLRGDAVDVRIASGQSLSGNVTIAQRFQRGEPALNIKSGQGTITVK